MAKSFKGYIAEGRSRGEEMEEFIVAAANGEPAPQTKYDIPANAGENVIKFLKKQGVTGKGEVLGASNINVSKEWASYWPGNVPASTKTPKTDFVIGKHRISLKSGSAAQLMSGGRNESLATFYTALKSVDGMQKDVEKRLITMFEGLAPASLAKGKLGDEIKKGKDEMVNKANAAHKELMGELTKIFDSNSQFANAFAYEAMSGETKFGPKSLGSCTHFLTTSFDGKKNKLKSVNDTAYVASIASQMKVSVRFKSSSQKIGGKKTGQYKYWSAVGLIVDKLEEDVNTLQGEVLTEGIIRNVFNKLKAFIKKVFAKIKQYISNSFYNLIDFLDVTPEVKVSGDVKL